METSTVICGTRHDFTVELEYFGGPWLAVGRSAGQK